MSESVKRLARPIILALLLAGDLNAQPPSVDRLVRDAYGGIIRGDVNAKKLALVFTGDEFGESTKPILDVLKERQIKGSFFVTGNFVRQSKLRQLLERARGRKVPARRPEAPARAVAVPTRPARARPAPRGGSERTRTC